MLTAGHILRKRREETRKSLSRVSQETKIQERFLRFIESDDYSKFDSGVFVSGFIKIYADYLDLDVDKVLALYRRTSKEQPKKKAVRDKKEINIKELLTPLNIAIAVISVAVITSLSYFNYQFNEFRKEPEIQIISPANESTVESETVSVLGVSDANSEVTLNGEKVDLKDDGSFEVDLKLEEGENLITILAKNSHNSEKETKKDLRIKYQKPEEDNEEEVEVQTYTARVEVIGEEAWMRITVDGEAQQQEFYSAGYKGNFEFKENITIGTGKPSITKLFINEKEYPITRVGAVSISCSIQSNKLNCTN